MNNKPVDFKWLIHVSDNSNMSVGDICMIYGIKKRGLHHRVAAGTFPERDVVSGVGKHRNSKFYWFGKTVKDQVQKDLLA